MSIVKKTSLKSLSVTELKAHGTEKLRFVEEAGS